MTGHDVIRLAEAYIGEGVQTDELHHRLSPALITLGLAELFNAEQMFRANKDADALTEPPVVEDLDAAIDYDWHILRELLPLWLAARYFDIDDDTERSAIMRNQYEQRRAIVVPAVWDYARDGEWCCHE